MAQAFFLLLNVTPTEAVAPRWAALQARVGRATTGGAGLGRALVDADYHVAWAAFVEAMPALAAAGATGWIASWSAGTGDLDVLLLADGAVESGTIEMDGQAVIRLGPKRSRRRLAPETVRAVREAWAMLYMAECPDASGGLDAMWPRPQGEALAPRPSRKRKAR